MIGSILIVDDDAGLLRTLGRYFERKNLEVLQALTGREAAELYERHRADVILLDLRLPDVSDLSLLEQLLGMGATVVMLTGHGDIPTAVQAVKAGAEEFLTKPVDLDHLGAVVEHALERARLKRAQSYPDVSVEEGPLAALGRSPQMRELAAYVTRVARAERTTVLLLGESGTGKGWLARRIHQVSPRCRGPVVEINCATLTGTFLESELFGHEKGAYTDAKTVKRGLFEIADTGTLFLDEIDELDLKLQPKLLNVLESRTFRRIGGTQEIEVDVRLIAASNIDLEEAVARREFRADLFHRLNVMAVELPPLRSRSPSDIVALAQDMVTDLPRGLPRSVYRISLAALDHLVRYNWPGNVRELRNTLERACIMAGDVEVLKPKDFPTKMRSSKERGRPGDQLPTLRALERHHIERALVHCKGNRTRAAELLGISRATLHKKIKKYGLQAVGREAT